MRALFLASLLYPAAASAQEGGQPAPAAAAQPVSNAERVRQLEAALAEKQEKREAALTSFVQLLGDAKAQTTTSGESSAAFGGGILFRSPNQSILMLARTDASLEPLDTQAERGVLMLTPESAGQPSFELEWRLYFLCMTRPFEWRRGSCSDGPPPAAPGAASAAKLPAKHDQVDFGIRTYLSGGTADWSIPAAAPMEAAEIHRAGVLAYGIDLALRREFIKGLDNYVGLEAGVGLTVRNLIGDFTAGENAERLRDFLGTDRKLYMGPELYIGLTINALNLGISLPVIPYGDIDGFSGGQLLVTAIVRDGPKLVIPE